MNTTTIQKWGNSYAVRLPKTSLRNLTILTGTPVEIRESDEGWTFSIVPTPQSLSLKEMSARITKKNSHHAIEWGAAKGKEIW